MKIMNYRKELVKRLFQKLGKKATDREDVGSQKTIRLTTMISVHDLENKKRQAIQFLKKNSILKFYIRVNKYDPDNIQKGKIMLMNIAEELKSYAKVKVSPVEEDKQQIKEAKESKDEAFMSMEQKLHENEKLNEEILISDDEEDDFEGVDVVYMELESTVSFGEYDIDSLLENSTMDELFSDIYKGSIPLPGAATASAEEAKKEYKGNKPELVFEEEQRAMLNKAQERLRLKARLRKRSAIFDSSEGDQEENADELVEEEMNLTSNEYDTYLQNKELEEEFKKAAIVMKDYCQKAFDIADDPLGFFEGLEEDT